MLPTTAHKSRIFVHFVARPCTWAKMGQKATKPVFIMRPCAGCRCPATSLSGSRRTVKSLALYLQSVPESKLGLEALEARRGDTEPNETR